MAGKVFFSVTMSLDGFIAPEEMSFHTPVFGLAQTGRERWDAVRERDSAV